MSKMPKYTLLHFHGHGRGDLSRLILHCAGVHFEDRHSLPHEPSPSQSQSKPDTTSLPFSELDDGHMLSHSNSIARYLARHHGLAGKNDWEQCQADMFVDCIEVLHSAMAPVAHAADPDEQKSMFDKVNEERIRQHILRVEHHLENKESNFLVGDAITWADLAYFSFFKSADMDRLGPEVLHETPRLKQLIESVGCVPGIRRYIESRTHAAH